MFIKLCDVRIGVGNVNREPQNYCIVHGRLHKPNAPTMHAVFMQLAWYAAWVPSEYCPLAMFRKLSI